MNDYIFCDYIYSSEDIKTFKSLCDTNEWKRIEVNDEYDLGNRYWIPMQVGQETIQIIDAYFDYISEPSAAQLSNHINASDGYTAEAKIVKYSEGDEYSWHCDTFGKMPGKNYVREISSITYLNDDFEGGETEFYPDHIITPVQGKTLVFPSNWCFVHRGRPVISGEKYILVQHFWV
jgi:Rps23 Pro-64 3,4-dihydroxylase Tpa1-like proline 4-hydroxylase